ncbi:DMT family transporter [Oscillatoria sp. FACHB-1407]|uniref:DMT family transporter n=1 Tax=Oscillatoria sp. FACHB-1407 TaxID=2692847 RepID=UPI001688262E|nr:DMT family transporter [Oscillatoria sp. FACHB-1407]MBD2464464.1 DMT family transporter [Oscillatoria sp. FACHB-1407]
MLGFLIVLLSSFFFCFQNVIVRVLFNQVSILGVIQTGGFVTPTLQHSFLLMFMRMVLVVPLMGAIASQLYPPTWKELGRLRQLEQRSLLLQSVGCGLLMFLYLALLYVSLGMIAAGISMTLFFTYPVFTALFSWRWFGDRPTLLRWSVMSFVFVGSALTIPHHSTTTTNHTWIGITTGLAAGVTYALYTVFAQKSFERLHPVPFTWLSFATTLVLSGISLLVWHGQEAHLPWVPLWIGGLLSALFTFAGHLLNNIGIRSIGATSAAMVAASNPALTAVLAWVAIQEMLSGLQIVGVAIASLGVALLSREHRASASKAS